MARKFVSPGVFTQEIDQSFLAQGVANIGAGVIGRTLKGPAFAPVTVSDFNGFVANFGDVDPSLMAPYAAKNYLKNSSTMQMVRVLGSRDGKTVSNGASAYMKALIDSTGTALAFVAVPDGWTLNFSASLSGGLFQFSSSSTVWPASSGVVSFTPNDVHYIGKIFNTDPTQASSYGHWLYKNFEWLGSGSGGNYVLTDVSGTGTATGVFDTDFTTPVTPWVLSQYGSQLFQIWTMGDGEASNTDVKVSIDNIRASAFPTITQYGTFDIIVRVYSDTDKRLNQVETFSNLSLDPTSDQYLPRVIGDQYVVWNSTTRKLVVSGTYKNHSKYIGVTMNSTTGAPDSLPWGHSGYPELVPSLTLKTSGTKGGLYVAGSVSADDDISFVSTTATGSAASAITIAFVSQSSASNFGVGITGSQINIYLAGDAGIGYPTTPGDVITANTGAFLALVTVSSGGAGNLGLEALAPTALTGATDPTYFTNNFPDVPYVADNLDSFGNTFGGTYWGLDFAAAGVADRLKFTLASGTGLAGTTAGAALSLTHLSSSSSNGNTWTVYNTASSGFLPSSSSQRGFTMAFFGGFDGFDPTQSDPLAPANTVGGTTLASISLNLAVDTLSNPDEIDLNLLAIPGIYGAGVTSYARQMCNDRADCMMIMDIAGTSVSDAISNLTNQSVDDNYAACYYPHLRYADTTNGVLVDVPPSVAVLGAFAYSDRVGQVFFAPAGLNRGGLQPFGIVDTSDRLTFQDRNDLYENRINPIATFPNEGIVVFGQKTLQFRPSALDRVNVRRLLIYAKKVVASAAKYLVFEPNNASTWQKFLNTTNPILEKIRQDQGIERFKVVMDSTVNTPDLIDRNIMTGKIFLQPTKTAEYIDLSFVITASGVSFEE